MVEHTRIALYVIIGLFKSIAMVMETPFLQGMTDGAILTLICFLIYEELKK